MSTATRSSESFIAVLSDLVWPVAVAWQRVLDAPAEKEIPVTTDPTESIRREMIATGAPARDLAEELGIDGPIWTTETVSQEFEIVGFMAPFVVVKRRSDGQKGSLEFTHAPRVYFNWVANG